MLGLILNSDFPLLTFIFSEEWLGQLTIGPARRIINLIVFEEYFSIFEDNVSLSIDKVASLVHTFAIEVNILGVAVFEHDERASFLIKVKITHNVI
jgi:hypothetical protein